MALLATSFFIRIQITSKNTHIVFRTVVNMRALILIKTVYLQIGLYIYGIFNHFGNPPPVPRAIFPPTIGYPLFGQIFDHITERGLRLCIEGENCPNRLRFLHVNHITGRLFAVYHIGFFLISIWNPPSHIKPLSTARHIGIGDAHLNGFAFELRKNDTNIQHRPSHWGRCIELFGT